MSKIYIPQIETKELVEKADMWEPQLKDYKYGFGDFVTEQFAEDTHNYNNHIASLSRISAPFLDESYRGKEMVEGVNFLLQYECFIGNWIVVMKSAYNSMNILPDQRRIIAVPLRSSVTLQEEGEEVLQALKEFDAYFDALSHPQKDGGHTWIAFTDKWNAFKKTLLSPAASPSPSIEQKFDEIFPLVNPPVDKGEGKDWDKKSLDEKLDEIFPEAPTPPPTEREGMRWVRASNRPPISGAIIRWIGRPDSAIKYEKYLDGVNKYLGWEIDKFEWLDESPLTSLELEVQRIK